MCYNASMNNFPIPTELIPVSQVEFLTPTFFMGKMEGYVFYSEPTSTVWSLTNEEAEVLRSVL